MGVILEPGYPLSTKFPLTGKTPWQEVIPFLLRTFLWKVSGLWF